MKMLVSAAFVALIAAVGFLLQRSVPTSSQARAFQEQHALAHLDNLPVTHIEDYTLVFPEIQASAEPSFTSRSAPQR